MEFLVLIGRVMFGMLFVASALGHLTQTSAMADYAESKGVPSAYAAIQASGVIMFVAAASVMLGVYADLGALILVIFLLLTASLIHSFWNEPEGDSRVVVQTQFMKDVALAGAALVMFAVFVDAGDTLGYALTGSLF